MPLEAWLDEAVRRSSATIDALAVATAARRRDVILTTDPGDVRPLADAAGVRMAIL